ncbi:MAG: AAA family ATPase [Firmicutes bacterium]|nr:AAA family ATPase [Bacillota bacterium]MDY5855582.1 AAA family ATPase [Anaerovoracaceae bacterium]
MNGNGMMTVKEAAARWNLTERRVTALCREGRIDGAEKKGRGWLLPEETARPEDHRITSGRYRKEPVETVPGYGSAGEPGWGTARLCEPGAFPISRRPLPIGLSDYRRASSNYYYVDKTLLIRDFLDEQAAVSLFTRPRRFGMTLNMDMLRTFFEKTEEDTSVFFRDKKIWACGEKYRMHQGKYPVIYLTFKDIKSASWENTVKQFRIIFSAEFARHSEVLESDRCEAGDKAYFRKMLDGTADTTELEQSLQILSRMLDQYWGIPPVLLIDEYDTPIQQGHVCGFYDEVILFMRNLFSSGLKDNRHLSFGFLTGILRVAKESLFSGLNNLAVNSILEEKYSSYFGFTPEEVREMTRYYDVPEKYEELCTWYDGYRFGGTEIFNPWSVVNYFRNNCRPGPYWLSTGSNDVIAQVLAEADEEIYGRLYDLLQGGSFLTYVDTSVVYPEIRKNPSSIYSFLLVTGYLKIVETGRSASGAYMCHVALPNQEIAQVYRKEVLEKFSPMIPVSTAISIEEALYTGDTASLQKNLRKLLLQSASYFDTADEIFYHGLLLGLCSLLDNRYFVTSNREAGEGRFDIQLLPKEAPSGTASGISGGTLPGDKLPGILIEVKSLKIHSPGDLKALAESALRQMESRGYDTELQSHGIDTIVKYGAAFRGKEVEVAMEEKN